MSKQERRAIGLSVLAALTGLGLAFHLHQGHWFSRSGSVITIIAILFAALELRARVARAPALLEEQLEQSRPGYLKQATDAGLREPAAEKIVREVESQARSAVRQDVQMATRRLLLIEVAIFVVGTVIWGFGDLPLDLWFKHDAATHRVETTANSSDVVSDCVFHGGAAGR